VLALKALQEAKADDDGALGLLPELDIFNTFLTTASLELP
jgi:hypothetical protein